MEVDRILLDIDTQRDFFARDGSCYSPQAAEAVRHVYRLFRWARHGQVPVISTVLRVRPNQRGPLAPVPHCVDGTAGERKLRRTILTPHVDLGLRNSTDLPADLFRSYRQVIFEMRHTDIFEHAPTERLITELPLATFVICGAGVAGGIVQAAIGLRSRGFGVILAQDAVLDLGDPLADMARRRMDAKGVVFAPTSEIIAPKPRRKLHPFRAGART